MHLLSGKVLLIVSLFFSIIDFPWKILFCLFEEIPKLPPITQEEVPDEPFFEEEEEEDLLGKPTSVRRNLKTSGPKVIDPYSEDQSSILLPLIIALAAIIPVIFCLCRL